MSTDKKSSVIDDALKQGKDWIAKPENQAQAKGWASTAWTWISSWFTKNK